MTINGKPIDYKSNMTILDILKGYKLSRHVVVMHVNGEIVPTDDYDNYQLKATDEIVLTSIVGGG